MKTDPRNEPAYPLAESARYLKLAPATLRSWVVGRSYPTARGPEHFPALIQPASNEPPLLSFWNLVEAHVLRSLRTDHEVSVKAVRQALNYAEKELGIKGLLRREELRAHGGELFLDRYGSLINLSASGQLAIRELLAEHLKRIDWDDHFPIRLYPFVSPRTADRSFAVGVSPVVPHHDDRPIVIDPKVAFGRPVVLRVGVSTGIIASRIDAGETEEQLAADYRLSVSEIKQAVVYERAA